MIKNITILILLPHTVVPILITQTNSRKVKTNIPVELDEISQPTNSVDKSKNQIILPGDQKSWFSLKQFKNLVYRSQRKRLITCKYLKVMII